MSVALIVLHPKEKYPGLYIPIATEGLFERVWQQGAKELNLEWLPLFQGGIDLTLEDFEAVSKELTAFEQWVKTVVAPIDPELGAFVSGRVQLLLQGLASLADEKEIKVFSG